MRGVHLIQLQPVLRTGTASITYGYSLYHVRSQPVSHTATACITYGYSLHHMGGYNLHHIGLQPVPHRVTACITYGHKPTIASGFLRMTDHSAKDPSCEPLTKALAVSCATQSIGAYLIKGRKISKISKTGERSLEAARSSS